MGKGSNLGKKSNHHLDDSETILKSKKKIRKEESSEKKTMKKLSKCENSKKVQESLLINPENLLKEEETPKKKFECGFSVPEAKGYYWGNTYKTIYVKGFDSSLPKDGIKSALSNHFTPCGEVVRVFVPVECETGARLGFAFINFEDKDGNKDEIEKALALNGSDFGRKEA